MLYREGAGARPRSVTCLGDALPAGWSIQGFDPDDGDPAVSSDDADHELLLGAS